MTHGSAEQGHPPVVQVSQITKRFASHTAIDQLSLDVPGGTIYGLLGPNGAGKTTTLRMILNILVPDTGTVRVFGVQHVGRRLSRRIGYLPEERGLYRKMRVMELLLFLAEIRGVRARDARPRAGEWLERVGLRGWEGRRVMELSKGMQQKVQFISAVLHQPDLLILDEPFAGMDPMNARLMKDHLVDLARQGTTIVLSTHIMEQAEKLCEHVCILAGGRTVAVGRLAEVKKAFGNRHVKIETADGEDIVREVLHESAGIAQADNYGRFAEVELSDGADPQVLLQTLVERGVRITRFEVAHPSLHKIFVDLVGTPNAGGEA